MQKSKCLMSDSWKGECDLCKHPFQCLREWFSMAPHQVGPSIHQLAILAQTCLADCIGKAAAIHLSSMKMRGD